MNEVDFLIKWRTEKPIYEAWGSFIIKKISDSLENEGYDIKSLFKVPVKERTKDEKSIIDKAYYRKKNYDNPYEDIEDKVGVRFVVLLLEEISVICKIITSSDLWECIPARDFNLEKEEEPLLFTYQSMHYILRPKQVTHYANFTIPITTPCEVQVRTLLQHAHAELTHDAIYKSTKKVKPSVHRTIAKSMALIETTDSFFSEATALLNSGPISEFKVVDTLDSIYLSATGLTSYNQTSSYVVFNTFEDCITENLTSKIGLMLEKYPFLIDKIISRYNTNNFYHQSVILFIYWLISCKKKRTIRDWPLDARILGWLATDLGISLYQD